MDKRLQLKLASFAIAGLGALATTHAAAETAYVGGLFQADFYSFQSDAGTDGGRWAEPFNTGANIRRAFLYVSGELSDVWEYQLGYRIVDSGVPGRDAFSPSVADFNNQLDYSWLAYTGMDPLKIAVGYIAVPFGLEDWSYFADTTFMERSSSDVFNPLDGVGLYLQGYVPGFTYQGAFYYPKYDQKGFDSIEPYGLSGRLTIAPIHDENAVLHIGGAYRTEKQDESSLDNSYQQLATSPGVINRDNFSLVEAITQRTFLSPGLGIVRRVNTWNVEAAGMAGPASLQAEYRQQKVKGNSGFSDLTFKGYYITAAYTLTGESRGYDETVGAFTNITPNSGAGAWELAFRYGRVDLSDISSTWTSVITPSDKRGKQRDYTVGLNWYTTENVKFQFNWVNAKAEYKTALQDRTLNTFALRAQYVF